MHPVKRNLTIINLAGGLAVLGSYAHGILTHATPGDVWGGVPESLKPLYTVSMLTAAAGYFAFTYFVFYRLPAAGTRIAGRLGYGAFNGIYLGILVPSALWMPLTFAMLESPSDGLWLAIRVDLAVVGLASLALLAALLCVRPREPRWAWLLAIAGAVAFCVQTALLDALVWPAYFSR